MKAKTGCIHSVVTGAGSVFLVILYWKTRQFVINYPCMRICSSGKCQKDIIKGSN